MLKSMFGVLLVVLLFYDGCHGKAIVARCPEYCECDMYENYRRAICRKANWVTIEANLPPEVQILDMSNNIIASLGDHVFVEMGLVSVKLLNLSHNAIKDVHMNAFLDLKQIKTIDLSYNALQRVVTNWFWDVDSLLELYINNNNLGPIGEDPILENKALKVLNISNCHIPYLYEHTFSKLPSLETLDISGNALIQLQLNAIKSLTSLNILNTYGIDFECNDNMKAVGDFCRQQGIRYEDICKPKTEVSEKSQKMVLPDPPIIHKNTWIFEDDDEGDSDEINASIESKTCSNSTNQPYGSFGSLILNYPVLMVSVPFSFGILIGILISLCLEKSFTCRKPPPRRLMRRKRRGFDAQPLVMFSGANPESTPMTPRKVMNTPTFENF